MSTVDNRVVRMQFDNAQFEQGITKSMKTLDEFDEKLKFKEASKGISDLQASLDSVSFSTLVTGVERLSSTFTSITGMIKKRIKEDIVDTTINAVKHLEQATIGQIKAGGWSRAMNLANAQFMVEGLKLDWDEMLKAINYGVQDTAYGLDAAAKAASSLAASGVGFEESVEGANDSLMHTSLRAISGVAAMTNSTYEDISRIFTSVAGNGKLMGDQLLQLSARGLNVAANLAQVMNTTEADIRDMVSKGKISFEMFATAMDDAFGAHAKEANKTFSGALSNMKAALSRIGAIFATPVIAKTNEVFIALTSKIKEVQKALSDLTDDEGNKVIRFAGHFAEAWESGVNAVTKLINAIDLSWFQKIADAADLAAQKVTGIFKDIEYYIGGYNKELKEDSKEVSDNLSLTAEEYKAVTGVIANEYGNGAVRIKNLSDAGFDEESRKRIQRWVDAVVAAKWNLNEAAIDGKKLKDSVWTANGEMSKMVQHQKELEEQEKMQQKISIHTIYNRLAASMGHVKTVAVNLLKVIKNLAGAAFKGFLKNVDPKKGASTVEDFSLSLKRLSEKLVELSEKAAPKVEKAFEVITGVVGKVVSKVFGAVTAIINFMAGFKKSKTEIKDTNTELTKGQRIIDAFTKILKKGFEKVKKIPEFFRELFDKIKEDERVKTLGEKLKGLWESFKKTADEGINPAITALEGFADNGEDSVDLVTRLADNVGFCAEKITWFVDQVPIWAQSVEEFFGKVEAKIETAKKTISEWWAAIDGKNLWDGLVNGAKGIFDDFGSAIDGIGEFGQETGEKIVKGLDEVDWDQVMSVGGITLFIAGIYKLMKLTDGVTGLLENLAEIPEAFGNVLEAFAGLGEILGASIGNITKAIEIGVITASIASIGLLVIALGKVPTEQLDQGIAAMVLIGVFFRIVIVGFINALNNFKSLSIAARQGTTFANKLKAMLVQILKQFVQIISMAALFISMAAAVYLIVKSIKTMAEINPDKLGLAFGLVITILAVLIGASIGIMFLLKKLTKLDYDEKIFKSMLSMAAMIFAIGFAVGIIAPAVAKMKEADVGWQEVGMVGLIMLVLTAMGLLLAKQGATMNAGKVFKAAISMVVLALAVGIVLGEIIGMAAVLTLFEKLGIGGNIMAAMGIVVGVLLAMAASIWLIGKGLKGAKVKPMAIMALVLSFAAIVGVIAFALEKMSGLKNLGGATAALIGTLVVVFIAMIGMLFLLKKMYTTANGAQEGADALSTIAFGILAIAAALYVIAAAAQLMDGTSWGGLAKLGVVFLVLAVAIGLLAKFVPEDKMKSIAIVILSIGGSVALLGLGVILLAAGIKLIQMLLPQMLIDIAAIGAAIAEHPVVFGAIVVIVIALVVALVALADKLGPVLSAVGSALKTAGEGILNFFKKIGGKLGEWIKGLSTTGKALLIGVIVALCGALLKSGPTIMKTIGKLIFMLLDFLGEIAGKLALSIVNLIIKLIYGITDAIMANSAKIANAIVGLVVALIDIVWEVIGQILSVAFGDKIGKWFAGVGAEMMENVHEARDIAIAADNIKLARVGAIDDSELQEDIEKIYDEDAIPDLEKLTKGTGNVASILSLNPGVALGSKMSGKDAANAMFPGVGTGVSWLTDNVKNMKSATDGANASIGEMMQVMGQFASSTNKSAEELEKFTLVAKDLPVQAQENLIKAGKGFRDSNGIFYEVIENQAEDIKNGAGQEFIDTMGEIGSEGGSEFNTGLLDKFQAGEIDQDQLMSQFGDMGIDVGDSFDTGALDALQNGDLSQGDFLSKLGVDSDEAFASGLISGQDSIAKAQQDNLDELDQANIDNRKDYRDSIVANVNNVAVAALNSAEPRYYDAASNSISGIVRAVKEGKTSVEAAYAELAQAGVDGYNSKDGQDSHSPSKKFYKNGVFSILGIVNAINQNEGMAVGAMTTLANSMVNSFGSSLSYVGKVASGELQYDPTIRPVLDTTRVSLGANSINSMFSRQSISLNGFSGQLAADIGQLDSRNSDVVSELQALREEMAYMTEEMTNMQMVVDSGALVGAISPGVDRSLGRMAKFRGRGN